MNELGRLERVIGPLVPEQAAGQAAKLAVHDPDQLLERLRVAGVPSIE